MANVFIVAPESLSTLFEGTPSIRKDAQRYKQPLSRFHTCDLWFCYLLPMHDMVIKIVCKNQVYSAQGWLQECKASIEAQLLVVELGSSSKTQKCPATEVDGCSQLISCWQKGGVSCRVDLVRRYTPGWVWWGGRRQFVVAIVDS